MAEDTVQALRAEVERLKKVVRALVDRAERSTDLQGAEFSLFQTAIVLGDQVRARTAELETALRENERIYRNLRESEAKYHALVDQSLVGIAIIEDERFNYVNPRFMEMYGYAADEIGALGPLDLVAEADRPRVMQEMRGRAAGGAERVHYQVRGRCRNGDLIDVEVHGSSAEWGGRRMLVNIVNDVSERCRAERAVLALQDELLQQSLHDPLTGLYNRRYLDEALGRELQVARRKGQPLSLLMGDLDHFKSINDHHGHPAGDAVLRGFADLLRRSSRSSDIACRVGGEEFLLVLPSIGKPGAVAVGERLRLAMGDAPTDFRGTRIPATASFGVSTFPEDGLAAEQLIAAADRALYVAKAEGRNRVAAA